MLAIRRIAALIAIALPLQAQGTATLLLVNGRIVTVDSSRPVAEAVAVRGDKVLAIGTTADMRKLAASGATTIDLKGRLAIPAFIEGHGHYTGLGQSKLDLDLTKVRSWDEIVAKLEPA
jgi:predicted amidohydrolase YtcJ